MSPAQHECPTPMCSNRLFEWVAALIMLQMGLTIVYNIIVDGRVSQAYNAISDFGIPTIMAGFLFVFIGAIRAFALWRNGLWKNGPLIRAVCAALGMFVWGQILYGVVVVWFKSDYLFISAPVWVSFLGGEYISFQRAILDKPITAEDPPETKKQ